MTEKKLPKFLTDLASANDRIVDIRIYRDGWIPSWKGVPVWGFYELWTRFHGSMIFVGEYAYDRRTRNGGGGPLWEARGSSFARGVLTG